MAISLERGGHVPHFDVLTVDARRVKYADLWQRRSVVFVSLDTTSGRDLQQYVRKLQDRVPDFAAAEAALVISTEHVPGFPSPGVVVADRWGEIVQVFRPDDRTGAMPSADELVEWTQFVRMQCPECPP